MIYFIQAGSGGPIKIGYTKSDPRLRLYNLQSMSPVELTVLKVIDGREEDEKALHRLLSKSKIRREWFEPDEQVFAMMHEVAPFGEPVQKPKKHVKAVPLPMELIHRIEVVAVKERRGLRGQVLHMLEEAVATRERKGKR